MDNNTNEIELKLNEALSLYQEGKYTESINIYTELYNKTGNPAILLNVTILMIGVPNKQILQIVKNFEYLINIKSQNYFQIRDMAFNEYCLFLISCNHPTECLKVATKAHNLGVSSYSIEYAFCYGLSNQAYVTFEELEKCINELIRIYKEQEVQDESVYTFIIDVYFSHNKQEKLTNILNSLMFSESNSNAVKYIMYYYKLRCYIEQNDVKELDNLVEELHKLKDTEVYFKALVNTITQFVANKYKEGISDLFKELAVLFPYDDDDVYSTAANFTREGYIKESFEFINSIEKLSKYKKELFISNIYLEESGYNHEMNTCYKLKQCQIHADNAVKLASNVNELFQATKMLVIASSRLGNVNEFNKYYQELLHILDDKELIKSDDMDERIKSFKIANLIHNKDFDKLYSVFTPLADNLTPKLFYLIYDYIRDSQEIKKMYRIFSSLVNGAAYGIEKRFLFEYFNKKTNSNMKYIKLYLSVLDLEDENFRPELRILAGYYYLLKKDKRAFNVFETGYKLFKQKYETDTLSVSFYCYFLYYGIFTTQDQDRAFKIVEELINDLGKSVCENMKCLYAQMCIDRQINLEKVYNYLADSSNRKYPIAILFMQIKLAKILGKDTSEFENKLAEGLKNAHRLEKKYYKGNQSTFMMTLY